MTTQCLWMKTFVQIVRIEINQKSNLFRAIKPGIDECKPSTRLMWTASVAACPQPLVLSSPTVCDFDLDSRGMGDWLLGDWLFGDFWELFYLAKYQIFSIRVVTLDHHKAWTTRANCANQEDCDCANSAKVDPTSGDVTLGWKADRWDWQHNVWRLVRSLFRHRMSWQQYGLGFFSYEHPFDAHLVLEFVVLEFVLI